LAPASGDDKPSFANSGVIGMKAISHNAWAGHVYGEWSHAAQGLAPQSLGGFLRLSGTPQTSLNGRTNILGRLVLAHKVGTIPATLGSAVRLGFSVEAGGAFPRRPAACSCRRTHGSDRSISVWAERIGRERGRICSWVRSGKPHTAARYPMPVLPDSTGRPDK
jgi:NTE family protein